jgi:hypothetical protein
LDLVNNANLLQKPLRGINLPPMSKRRLWFNYFGMVTSFLCLVHCLVTPALIVIFPILFGDMIHDLKYELFFILLLALGSLTFWEGYNLHKSRRSLVTAGLGFVLLVSSLLIRNYHLDMVLSVLGGICMLLAHYWNYKLCRCHGHHH